MRIKIERVMMNQFIGGLLGKAAILNAGFTDAYYVWDASVDPDGSNCDTVLVKRDYLSIRTKSRDKWYINEIAERLLGSPYNYTISFDKGIAMVERIHENA